jgi:hypothetical protein
MKAETTDQTTAHSREKPMALRMAMMKAGLRAQKMGVRKVLPTEANLVRSRVQMKAETTDQTTAHSREKPMALRMAMMKAGLRAQKMEPMTGLMIWMVHWTVILKALKLALLRVLKKVTMMGQMTAYLRVQMTVLMMGSRMEEQMVD